MDLRFRTSVLDRRGVSFHGNFFALTELHAVEIQDLTGEIQYISSIVWLLVYTASIKTRSLYKRCICVCALRGTLFQCGTCKGWRNW